MSAAEWIPFDTTTFFQHPPNDHAERDAWAKKPRMPFRSVALTDRPIVRYLGRDSSVRTIEGWQRWIDITVEWLREGRSPTITRDGAGRRVRDRPAGVATAE